jgi:hypothetical protein
MSEQEKNSGLCRVGDARETGAPGSSRSTQTGDSDALRALVLEFIAYWTTDRAYGNSEVGCGMCGGVTHSTTCYVGRMDKVVNNHACAGGNGMHGNCWACVSLIG